MADAERWDERYREGRHGSAEPDPFLRRTVELWRDAEPPATLDLACGAGRNAVYLARQGRRVVAVDFSAEALKLAAERARGLDVAFRRMDLEAEGVELGEGAYGLVVVVQYLHRPLFESLRRAVAPGGLILYKTYGVGQLALEGGPRDRRHLLDQGELQRVFADWEILRSERQSDPATEAILARKPADRPGTR